MKTITQLLEEKKILQYEINEKIKKFQEENPDLQVSVKVMPNGIFFTDSFPKPFGTVLIELKSYE